MANPVLPRVCLRGEEPIHLWVRSLILGDEFIKEMALLYELLTSHLWKPLSLSLKENQLHSVHWGRQRPMQTMPP